MDSSPTRILLSASIKTLDLSLREVKKADRK